MEHTRVQLFMASKTPAEHESVAKSTIMGWRDLKIQGKRSSESMVVVLSYSLLKPVHKRTCNESSWLSGNALFDCAISESLNIGRSIFDVPLNKVTC